MMKLSAWAYLAVIAYVSLSPIAGRLHFNVGTVRVAHVLAFALLGMVFVLAYPQRLVLIASLVLGSTVLLECLQSLTPDRHARWTDAAGKLVGGSLGIWVAFMLLSRPSR